MADVDKIIKQKHKNALDVGKQVNSSSIPPSKITFDTKIEKAIKENNQTMIVKHCKK